MAKVKIIVFVTGNETKILHANKVLNKYGYEAVGKKLDLTEPREENPEDIVLSKADQAFGLLNTPLMVEDSGIFIRALGGFPKTFVKFALGTVGIENILKMMEGVEDRYVEFRQSLAYIAPGMKRPKVFNYVDGNFTLAEKIWPSKYESGEFDKILIPPGEKKAASLFSKEWRAKRDARANEGKIHYQQLAKWL